jgi:chromosome segregation ATPase
MKGTKLMAVLSVAFFIFLLVALVITFVSYKDIKQKAETYSKETKTLGEKVNEIEMSLESFKTDLATFKKDYDVYIEQVTQKMNETKIVKKEINDQLETIKNDIKSEISKLQDIHTKAIDALNDKVNAIQREFEQGKIEPPKKVDLGEISVKEEPTVSITQ